MAAQQHTLEKVQVGVELVKGARLGLFAARVGDGNDKLARILARGRARLES